MNTVKSPFSKRKITVKIVNNPDLVNIFAADQKVYLIGIPLYLVLCNVTKYEIVSTYFSP